LAESHLMTGQGWEKRAFLVDGWAGGAVRNRNGGGSDTAGAIIFYDVALRVDVEDAVAAVLLEFDLVNDAAILGFLFDILDVRDASILLDRFFNRSRKLRIGEFWIIDPNGGGIGANGGFDFVPLNHQAAGYHSASAPENN